MDNYENLQKISYALIAIMIIFNFFGSIVYEQEIDEDESGGATIEFYLDEAKIKDSYASDSFSYSEIGFSKMEDVMTNLGYLSISTLLVSAFFAWKIKVSSPSFRDIELTIPFP